MKSGSYVIPNSGRGSQMRDHHTSMPPAGKVTWYLSKLLQPICSASPPICVQVAGISPEPGEEETLDLRCFCNEQRSSHQSAPGLTHQPEEVPCYLRAPGPPSHHQSCSVAEGGGRGEGKAGPSAFFTICLLWKDLAHLN